MSVPLHKPPLPPEGEPAGGADVTFLKALEDPAAAPQPSEAPATEPANRPRLRGKTERWVARSEWMKHVSEFSAAEADRWADLHAERRRWQWVALGMGVLASLCIFALAMLAPLKTVVPFLLVVEDITGVVRMVPPAEKANPTEWLIRGFLAEYVARYHGYNWVRVENDYKFIVASSVAEVGAEYRRQMLEPRPIDERLGNDTQIVVDIRSVSPDFTDSVARISFDTRHIDAMTGAEEVVESWIATVSWSRNNEKDRERDEEMMMENPYDLLITSYAVNRERRRAVSR